MSEIRGDVWRCVEMCGDVWSCGEMWGDVWRGHTCVEERPYGAALSVGSKIGSRNMTLDQSRKMQVSIMKTPRIRTRRHTEMEEVGERVGREAEVPTHLTRGAEGGVVRRATGGEEGYGRWGGGEAVGAAAAHIVRMPKLRKMSPATRKGSGKPPRS